MLASSSKIGAAHSLAQPAPVRDRWDGLLCTTAVLLLILATRPFVEMGLIDDFSYVKTAWDFAHTGHFIFNGWATAMLGWQVIWGALFVRLLGDSFFAPRLSVLLVAGLSVLLLHAILRRGGLTRSNATFGTLVVGLSPIFVPLSVTFMTDVGGLFVILLSLYCCLRATTSHADGAALGWIVAGNIVGAAGGTVRQIAWLTVLVMLPCTAWLLRRRRRMLSSAAGLWVVSVIVVQQSLSWFRRQPFSVPEPIIQGSVQLRSLRELAGTMLAAGLCLALLLTPVLAAGLRPMIRLRTKGGIAALVTATIASTWLCHFITAHLVEHGWMPWTGDVVDRLGVFDCPNAWLIGVSPVSFTEPMRMVASALVIGLLLIFALSLTRWTRLDARRVPYCSVRSSGTDVSWQALLLIAGPFTAAYILLLVPRGIWAEVLDRYLLPLLTIAVLLLLRLVQERIGKVPRESWAVLALLAAFSLAGTHDWIASHRARLQAVQRLRAAGIANTEITAGYEADGLSQILLGGAVIDPRVAYPVTMRIQAQLPQGIPQRCASLLDPHTPEIQPRFFLAYQRVPCLEPSRFGDQPYRTWLFPTRRSIRILQFEARSANK